MKTERLGGGKKITPSGQSSTSKFAQQRSHLDQQAIDISSLNLDTKDAEDVVYEPPPKISLARERVLEEARKALETSGKKAVSLVVIGN